MRDDKDKFWTEGLMPLHTDSHSLHTTLNAIQGPGDAVYKGAILVVAALMLLTALV